MTFASICLLIAMSPTCEPHPFPQMPANTTEPVLEQIRLSFELPGISVSWTCDGRSHHEASVGFADSSRGIPLQPEHKMLAASIGKTFVAALAAKNAADGLLLLDSPIHHYLRDAAWLPRVPNGQSVTLRQLLRHRSGIPNHINTDGFLSAIRSASREGRLWSPGPVGLLSYVFDVAPVCPPGTCFHYSDTNYILAGVVLEQALNRQYYDLLVEQILQPYELDDVAPANGIRIPKLANGYLSKDNYFELPPQTLLGDALVFDPSFEWTGGGLAATPTALNRWIYVLATQEFLLKLPDRGAVDFFDFSGHYPQEVKYRYGLGLQEIRTSYGLAVGHRGFMPGYSSAAFHIQPIHLTLTVMTNADYRSDIIEIFERVAEAILAKAPASQQCATSNSRTLSFRFLSLPKVTAHD